MPGISTSMGIPFREGGFSFAPAETPTLLIATTFDDTQIDLAWTDNSTNEDGYSIERSGDNITFVEIDTVLVNIVAYSDTTCVEGTLYYYRVRAYRGATYSNYSNTASDTTVLNAPTLLTATTFDDAQIDLAWTDNATNEDGYSIERSPDNATWAEIAVEPPDATTHNDSTCVTGTLYYYRIRAFKGIVWSGYSNIRGIATDGTFDNGKLLFTFDDGGLTQYTLGFPSLQGKGVVATFYLVSNTLDAGTQVTYANALEMSNAGMDMQCHSQTHVQLTLLSDAEIIAEIETVNARFIANGLPVPLHHAYPGGSHNYGIEELLKSNGLRKTARSYGASSYYPIYADSDKYSMPSVTIDNIDATAIAAIKVQLDSAKLNKTALILAGHGFGGTSVSIATMEDLIDYALGIGIDIITMSQLYDLMWQEPVLLLTTNLVLTSTGAGSGVATLTMAFKTNCTITLDGNGKFYSDALGTLNESSEWHIIGAGSWTVYIRCNAGTSNMVVPYTKLRYWETWTAGVNAPSIGGDISKFTEITKIDVRGNNTLSGDITLLKLIWLWIVGSNTITGDISNHILLTILYMKGSNTICGDLGLNSIGNGLTECLMVPCAMITYTGGAIWTNTGIDIRPSAGYGYDQTEIGNILIDADNSGSPPTSKSIALLGSNASMADTNQGGIWGDFSGVPAPSALAMAYKSLIKVRSDSLYLTGISVPAGAGDGTGFPAGFGDWYRS